MKLLVIVALFCLVVPSWADDDQSDSPTSADAEAALAKFDEAKAKAAKPVAAAEETARKQYLLDLKHVLDATLKSADLTTSNWVKQEIDRVSGGDAPTPERPKAPPAINAWTRYTRAVERANDEVHQFLETARRQCIAALVIAKRNALSKRQDLKEGNLIAAQIAFISSLDFNHSGQTKINLLTIVDPTIDAVEGKWQFNKDALVALESHVEGWPRRFIEFPITPPEEYDYSITYKYVGGTDCYTQTCYAAGHQFGWNIAAGNNRVCQLRDIASGATKTTRVEADHWLINGRFHTSLVKVRTAGVEAYLDGKLIAFRKTDYQDMNSIADALHHPDMIGFGMWGHPAVIVEAAELVEITGKSKLARAANPQ